MAGKKKPTFEEQLAEAEQIIARMEGGGMPLEETLTSYEKAAALLQSLEADLTQAQQRLTVLRRGADGTDHEEPMEAPDEGL